MAKMVGLNLVIKLGWMKKAVSLLPENLPETEYRKELDEHLAFEIDSPTNRRKAREIMMRVWYQDSEGVEKLQQRGRELIQKYPDQLTAIGWCMIPLAYPVFADYAKLMGKMFEFQDVITTTQIKQKMFDELGERNLIEFATTKVISTMKELGAVRSVQTGKHEAVVSSIAQEEVVAFMVEVAMFLGGSSYYAFSSLTEFPFLFPFKYRVTKEQLMQDERFTLSTFDATLCVALK